jgi:hypothetical protein
MGTDEQPTRAKQSIPPATRRKVLRRDRGCCRVPGCRNSTFVDVHHLCLRTEGGDHDVENLVTLCAAHHRAIHEGRLFCEGKPAMGLVFRHADGTPYGGALSVGSADIRAKAFRALRAMGFRESEAHDAFARIPLVPDPTLESLVRLALGELVPSSR